jgi:hypothetical protein
VGGKWHLNLILLDTYLMASSARHLSLGFLAIWESFEEGSVQTDCPIFIGLSIFVLLIYKSSLNILNAHLSSATCLVNIST